MLQQACCCCFCKVYYLSARCVSGCRRIGLSRWLHPCESWLISTCILELVFAESE
ncbi:hypothetical protein IscW_ISCW012924 [Ixodes scapularis]|uniref:Uncharacterized protein n=1 Tax=Ixodes scapularis TaxID=6945 RepID=B7QCB0_IXOSC|nr:hypothetical protein IscW_ISCW012924 [Ixodes scapularis]|eukprot:XP_002413174.1 hypothetical protein IscW_ISCW012924 [Ixodes scapularis]